MQSLYAKRSVKRRLLSWLWQRKLAILMILTGLVFLFNSTYIHSKALLAQWLIKDAWQDSLTQQHNVSPWSWADTYPVAKLRINGEDLYVLSGVSGRVMAFGPGHLDHTPLPGEMGNSVITGHRDTHFSLLEDVQLGQQIFTQTRSTNSEYTVTGTRIVHESQLDVLQDSQRTELTLITCYPFDGSLPDTPWRYVVKAVRGEG